MTADIFYTVAFQLLGFSYFVDFEDSDVFRKETGFPIVYGNLIENLYQLLNTRTKKGNTLIDQLVSDGLIPEDNNYHYFNGKSLATFLAMMPFEKSFTLSLVSILTEKGYQT